MQNKLELSLLIDYYGAFLTDNQCEMLKLNCEEDFSLAEIAEQKGISRQGVRDALQRGEKNPSRNGRKTRSCRKGQAAESFNCGAFGRGSQVHLQ